MVIICGRFGIHIVYRTHKSSFSQAPDKSSDIQLSIVCNGTNPQKVNEDTNLLICFNDLEKILEIKGD
jgi:hypothetical protein